MHPKPTAPSSHVHRLGFIGAVAGVIGVSIAAYAQLLPPWIAPGNADKAFHFAMGGVLAFFLDRALRGRAAWRGRLAPPLSSLLVLVLLGIEEYLQRFSAVRTSSFWDFAADFAGVVVLTFAARSQLFSAASRSRSAQQRGS